MRITRRKLEWTALVIVIGLATGTLNEAIGGESIANSFNQVGVVLVYLMAIPFVAMRYITMGRAFGRDWLLALLLVYVVLSSGWSAAPHSSLIRAVTLCGASIFSIYVGSRLPSEELSKAVSYAMLWLIVANIAFSVVFPGDAVMSGIHEGALRGIFGQKNSLARAMALAIPMMVVWLKGGRRKLLPWVGLSGGIALLLLTRSATGLAVTVLLIIALPLLQGVRLNDRLVIPLLLVMATLTATGAFIAYTNFEGFVGLLGRDVTLTGRTYVWAHVVRAIGERPLHGYGYGGYWLGWDGPSANVWSSGYWKPNDSHNGILDLLLDLGVVGTTIFIFHYLQTLVLAIKRFRDNTSAYAWAVVVMVHFFLYNITESSVLRPTNFMWIAYTLVATCVRNVNLQDHALMNSVTTERRGEIRAVTAS